MRTTQTFVLRLLVDPSEPQALRGALHAVASGEEGSFSDEPGLVTLLHRMTIAAPETASLIERKEASLENQDLGDAIRNPHAQG